MDAVRFQNGEMPASSSRSRLPAGSVGSQSAAKIAVGQPGRSARVRPLYLFITQASLKRACLMVFPSNSAVFE